MEEKLPSSVKEASSVHGIPCAVIERMVKEKILSFPFRPEDMVALAVLSQIWGRVYYVRKQLSDWPKNKREMYLKLPTLTKYERFMLTMLIRGAERGKRYPVEVMVDYVRRKFAMSSDPELVKKLIQAGYRMKKLVKNSRKAIEEIVLDESELEGTGGGI